jgi:hypothetical protein
MGDNTMKISKWMLVTVFAAGMAGNAPAQGVTRITGVTNTGGSLVLTFDGPGTEVLGTASLADPDWRPADGAAVSGNTVTVPMGAQRFFAVAGDGAPAENSAGFISWPVPAGKLQIVSIPFDNPSSDDGAFKFGDTQIAQDLPQGSTVLFWDAGSQAWSGGSKSARGWAFAQANHVFAPGEAFLVRHPSAYDVQVTASGLAPTNATRSRVYAGGGAWTPVANPYPVESKFGDTELASQLPQGSTVLFWDVGRQGWSGGAKSSRGWPAAVENRMIAPGEGFFVKSPEEGAWEAARPYASAVPPASGGGQP